MVDILNYQTKLNIDSFWSRFFFDTESLKDTSKTIVVVVILLVSFLLYSKWTGTSGGVTVSKLD